MLPTNLNTNEVKNSAGTEVEFSHYQASGREKIYAQTSENPSQPHRISFRHQETGSGMKARRRSVCRVDKTILSPVDNLTPVTVSAYMVVDSPQGALTNTAEVTNVVAELLSLTATTGAATTVLFNGTGTGAVPLIDGSL